VKIGKTEMQPINDRNRKRELTQKLQPLVDEHQRNSSQANARATHILRHYDKAEFRRKFYMTLETTLSTVLYEDIAIVIGAIAQTVKNIKPDETVDHNRHVTERLMKKAMWATTSSIKYILAKRRKFRSDEIQPKVIQLTSSAVENLTRSLSSVISGMTAQESAIFLGKLSGIYFKTCPKELIRNWKERRNENPNSLFTTWALEGELLMSIDF
jgi:hypothetical protein